MADETALQTMNQTKTTPAAMSTPKAPRKRTVKAPSPTIADLAAPAIEQTIARDFCKDWAATDLHRAYQKHKEQHESTGFAGQVAGWPVTATLHFSDLSSIEIEFADWRELNEPTTPAPAAEAPHEIGQPITHAPTIAALAELVTLATAQMERAAQTSPAQAAAFTRMQAAHIVFEATYQTGGRHDAIVELEAAEVMFIADMPGATVWVRDEETGAELQPVTHAFEAGDIRTPMYGVRCWGEFCPADMSKDEALAYFAAYDANREQLCAIKDELTSPVAGPTINEMEAALTTSGFFVGGLTDSVIKHYYTKLIVPSLTLEADTPAPVLIPSEPTRKRKFPFTALRLAGHAVRMLHQIGKCAVAKVTTFDHNPRCFYALRYRQHTIDCAHFDLIPQAMLTLRGLDNAEIRRDNEVLTVTDALDQLYLSLPCLNRFCAHHGLDVDRSYKRRELRRAITDRREPRMPVYLSLLNKLTVTNPATI